MKLPSLFAYLAAKVAASHMGPFSAVVLLAEGKHAVDILTDPFKNCHCLADILQTFWKLSSLEWVGWWGFAIMLFAAVAGLMLAIGHQFSPSIAKRFGESADRDRWPPCSGGG
jgi:hypothetical protein